MSGFARRLEETLAGSVLAAPLPPAAARFAERRGGDEAARRIDGPALRGLARVLVSEPQVAGFTSHRPGWLERVAALSQGGLAARAAALPGETEALLQEDLEPALDALRLCRREEMALAACADLGKIERFEDVSEFLSLLAETILGRALTLARRETRGSEGTRFSVLGMGKLAGRELTYHSDLDLIFLYQGGPEEIDTAARLGQRLISYLTTMTGAGVAYEVDTRLRPSGRQGMLVTGSESFERYQTRQAQTWEHLAVLRSRAVAGDAAAAAVLARVHAHVLARREAPWAELAPLRRRVELERGGESSGRLALKTGPGGLMDVDFLAGGGLLERGARAVPALPSVAAMLRACAGGPRVEAILDAYRSLRITEARARWLAGRGVEVLELAGATVVAELVEPGLDAAGLAARIDAARRNIREAFDAVVKAGTLDALDA
jgi:glutamate-ammonia-ligase adenylyltransferase